MNSGPADLFPLLFPIGREQREQVSAPVPKIAGNRWEQVGTGRGHHV